MGDTFLLISCYVVGGLTLIVLGFVLGYVAAVHHINKRFLDAATIELREFELVDRLYYIIRADNIEHMKRSLIALRNELSRRLENRHVS